MEFTHPIALLGLILLIPLIIGWIKWLQYKVYSSKSSTTKNRVVQGLLLTLKVSMVGMLTLLLAGPYTLQSVQDPLKNGVDIILVLDLSKSMFAEDIIPSRIESARNALQTLVSESPQDRIGLIGFAGKPFTLSPLSFDAAALKNILARTGVDTIKQELPGLAGTALGDSLLLASEEFGEDLGRERVMLVITDGEANIGIAPRDTLSTLKQKNIRVHTIGVGDPRGTELSVTNSQWQKKYFLNPDGSRIIASIDEPLLREIAQFTGGTYQNAKSTGALESVITAISKLEKKPLQAPPVMQKRGLDIYFAGLVFLLAILLCVVEQYHPTSLLRIGLIRSSIYTSESHNYRVSHAMQRIIIGCFILGTGLLGYVFWNLYSQTNIPDWTPLSLVVDLSRSMLVEDVRDETNTPISRLALAQKSMLKMLTKIPRSQWVSLIWFGGVTEVLVPNTLNRDALVAGISSLKAGSIAGGSNLSTVAHDLSAYSGSSAILFTDGAIGDRSEWELSLSTSTRDIGTTTSKNPLYIALIGSKAGGPIPIPSKFIGGDGYLMKNGIPVVSVTWDAQVKKFFPWATLQSLSSANDSSQIEEWLPYLIPTISESMNLFDSYGNPFLFIASILLLLALLLPARYLLPKYA